MAAAAASTLNNSGDCWEIFRNEEVNEEEIDALTFVIVGCRLGNNTKMRCERKVSLNNCDDKYDDDDDNASDDRGDEKGEKRPHHSSRMSRLNGKR